MERSSVIIPSKVYTSLNLLVQAVRDSVGSGQILVVQCDSPKILKEFENQLKNLKIQPHTYNPRSWKEMHSVLITHGDDPNWGVAIWKFDLETPDELYSSIDFNRDVFLEVRWPSVFWATSIAIKKLMQKAPNFWRYRAAFVPFPPIPHEPHEVAQYFAMFLRPSSEWKSPEEIERELKSLKKLLDSTEDPVRRARFLARIGRLELDLFIIKGDRTFLDRSISHLSEAVSIMESRKSHDLIFAEALNNYGQALISAGEYDQSVGIFKKALDVLDKLPQDSVSSVLKAEVYSNLGIAYEHRGEYDVAIEYYKKALEIRLKVLGEEHLDTAATYINLGSAYASKGEYDRAIELYQRALNILEKMYRGCHPLTETVVKNLANVYLWKGESDRASELDRWFAKVKSECQKFST